MNELITQQELKELLHYNPDTGVFTWIKDRGSVKCKNRIAGCDNGIGYLVITVTLQGKRKSYKLHRLAWLYIYGEWPKNFIDHINHNTIDNRISNLRDVSFSGNSQNRNKPSKTNSTGYLGVSNYTDGKFKSQIILNYEYIFLGVFDTAIEAHKAYLQAKRKYHKTCTI